MIVDEVYSLKIEDVFPKSKFDTLIQCVQQEQRERILKFKLYKDALRTLAADILIRDIIINKGVLRNPDILFKRNQYGKPCLKNTPNFHFNLSHSGQWVVCAVSNVPVGIDIEEIVPIDLKIAIRFFAKEEIKDLFSLVEPERLPYFYDLWTLKESYIKAIGKGLSIPLNTFALKKDANGGFYLQRGGQKGNYYFKQYKMFDNYTLSVCSIKNKFTDHVNVFDMDRLFMDFLREEGCYVNSGSEKPGRQRLSFPSSE